MKHPLKTSFIAATAVLGLSAVAASAQELNVYNWSDYIACLLYTSPSPRDLSTSRMPSSA